MRNFAIAFCVLCVLGCGGETEKGVVDLTVVVWKADTPQGWEKPLADFHTAHPDIRVTLDIQPNNATILHDVLTQKLRNKDTSVDAFLMDVTWPPEFASAGWALAVDEQFPESERGKFFPGCIDSLTCNGKIYGVPLNTDSGLLYFRRDLLEKYGFAPPETWQEMVVQVAKIRAGEKDENLHGYSGQFKQYEGLVCDMLEFVHSNGGKLAEPDGAEAVEAITFVRDHIIGKAAPRGVLTYQEQESLDLFRSGGAIFHRNWPYAWAVSNDPKGSKIAGKVGIARLPTFKTGKNCAALGGWSWGISAFSEHPDEAWSFVSFMTSAKMQKHFALVEGKLPPRPALYGDADVLRANPHFGDLLPVFMTATPRPRSPVYPRISNILQPFLHEAISKPDSDVAALAKEAAEKIRKQ
ncbi:MAG: ABC transporter substrate-binding protein [Planctomycetota bacterium]|jgi:multiple sugar transport system substrate-binding protein